MISKRVPFIYSIIILSIELIYTILMVIIAKMGAKIESLVLALWSIPLLPLAIISLVGGLIHLHHSEVKKKAIAVVIMGSVAVIYFCLYALCLGFLVGTGHLPFYYFLYGF